MRKIEDDAPCRFCGMTAGECQRQFQDSYKHREPTWCCDECRVQGAEEVHLDRVE